MSAVEGKKIAIVGGGPGGLTLARLLQQSGAQVAVYERDQSRSARVQGSALDLHEDSGLAALEAAGLIDAFWVNHRPDLDNLRLTDVYGAILHDHPRRMSGAGQRPEIERGPLRDLLLDSLQPGTVEWDCKLDWAEMQGEQVLLRFASGKTALADITIGSDGANSRLRELGHSHPAGVCRSVARRGARSCGKADYTEVVGSPRRVGVNRSRRRKNDRHGNQA